MSVTNIKKMNVRSPYYVVVKGDEAAEVTPTETVITEETFVCGGTKSIGAFVGKKKYNISAIGRDNGDYTVSFSGVKFPIKYRIGLASNIDNISFTTKGLDTYATEWGNAGENTADLDAAGSYPNGLTFDATYTSTGDDAIMLEVYHPLISTVDYSFSLSCADVTPVATPVADGFVTVISLINQLSNVGTRSAGDLFLNNSVALSPSFMTSQVSSNNVYGGTTRAVLSGGTEMVATNNSRFLNFASSSVYNNIVSGSQRHATFYRNDNYVISGGVLPNPNIKTSFPNISIREGTTNTISMTGGYLSFGTHAFALVITRHPVIDISGTKYIQGNDQVTIKGIIANFALTGSGSSVEFAFRGGNETELQLDAFLEPLGRPIIDDPVLEEQGFTPNNFGTVNLVTFDKF